LLKSLSIPITEPSQVGEARRVAQRLGTQFGFDEKRLGDLGIVATELATNLYKHAKGGELLLRKLEQDGVLGLEILSLDRGPGIAEVSKCLEDGYSTAGTPGNGLGSIKRLSSVFDLYSTPHGTALVSQVWTGPRPANRYSLEFGAACLPYPGESRCGDGWATSNRDGVFNIIVADGLGHGEHAADAADQAVEVFKGNSGLSPQLHLQKLHGALRSTRGAAVVVLQTDLKSQKITYSGIGNISGGAVTGGTSKSFVSLNGTIGHQAQRFQEFTYEWSKGSFLILYSDGLQSKWKLDGYLGLSMRHPSLIAGTLYRDFRRERDDVTVLIVRNTSK
jgi:anti-sigma regulatory factor (Ser/Thr protein kinase)